MTRKIVQQSIFTRSIWAHALTCLLLTGCMRSQTELETTRAEHADEDLDKILERAAVPDHPLTLNEVLEIALKSNLDILVKELDYAFEYELATGSKYKMLPSLIAEGEISYRNKNTGSSSESLTNQPPAPPSISSQQHVNRYDITFTWKLLDFGISYYRARQQANKAVSKRFDIERQRQNVIMGVVEHFWKARAAMKGISGSQELLKKAKQYQETREKDVEARVVSTIEGYRTEAQLIRAILQMQVFEKSYHREMSELSNLMGLHPNIPFTLAEEPLDPITVHLMPVEDLEELALTNRPELYTADMEALSYTDDIRIALLQVFPDPNLFVGNFYDSNRFLVYKRWLIAGLRWSWNLLSVPSHIQEMISADTHLDMSKASRLAISVGILTQLHLAYIQFSYNLDEYQWNDKLRGVQRRLLASAEKEHEIGELGGLDLLQIGIDTLIAEIDTISTYGETRLSIERINNSIGIPFYIQPKTGEDHK